MRLQGPNVAISPGPCQPPTADQLVFPTGNMAGQLFLSVLIRVHSRFPTPGHHPPASPPPPTWAARSTRDQFVTGSRDELTTNRWRTTRIRLGVRLGFNGWCVEGHSFTPFCSRSRTTYTPSGEVELGKSTANEHSGTLMRLQGPKIAIPPGNCQPPTGDQLVFPSGNMAGQFFPSVLIRVHLRFPTLRSPTQGNHPPCHRNQARLLSRRSSMTVALIDSTAKSISSLVVKRLSPNRRLARTASSPSPNARNT
jgi:hypothetical protein